MTEDTGLIGRCCGQQPGEMTRDPTYQSPGHAGRDWGNSLG